jgi:hypothetical protein
MNKIALLILALVAIIVIILILYTSMSGSATTTNSLIYENTVLYTGKQNPIFTSDGIDLIVYLKDNGTYQYNTATGQSRKISDKVPKGLAYDGTYFMMLDQMGTLYQIDTQGNVIPTESGYTKLYDTIDGYYLATAGFSTVTGQSGSTTRNLGNYGLIDLQVI